MKKRIFIGSSSEEIGTAKIVKGLLEPEFEVVIWDENIWDKSIFKLNGNFLTNLLTATLKFDFGILLGSPDDKVESRGVQYLQARDNVLLELGLFIGRLGIDRCAFLVDENVKIPSDFGGIKISMFDSKNLADKVEEIKMLFNNASRNNLNFFPSSTLAATYYENFVRLVCDHYYSNQGFIYNDEKYKSAMFNIFIPKYVTDDIEIQSKRMQSDLNLDDEISFGTASRKRNVKVSSSIVDGELVLADFPTILTGIKHAISNLLPNVFNKQGAEYELVLNRELDKFIDSLEHILKRNKYDDFVKIHRIE